jgi:hypothetical protein
MAMTPAYALANVFLPNLVKLKGAATVVGAVERKDLVFLDTLWAQAQVTHQPHITAQKRDTYKIATISFPLPKEIGEAYAAGVVVKLGDPSFARVFTLEHDYVLAKQASRTLLVEREGTKTTKRGDGPAWTGNPDADAAAFVECFMELIVPTKVTRK